jgi:hypothetical protein
LRGARFFCALEAHVPAAALAALRHHHGLIRLHEVSDQLVGVVVDDSGSHGNLHHQVLGTGAGHLPDSATLSIIRHGPCQAPELQQGIAPGGRPKEHVATTASIAPIRATERDILLAPKGHGALATAAAGDFQASFVDESHGRGLEERGDAACACCKESGRDCMPHNKKRASDSRPFRTETGAAMVPLWLGVLTALPSGFDGVHRHLTTVATPLVPDHAIAQCEDGVVTTETHTFTGMELGPGLSDQDASSGDGLAIMTLQAVEIRVGITTIPC